MNIRPVLEAIREMVREDRAAGHTPRPSWTMRRETRQRGLAVPSKPWVQAACVANDPQRERTPRG
jgi:hypothetical protein